MSGGRRAVRYGALAAALGAGWFVVLLIPRLTREFLLERPPRNVACLVIASVVVAFILRGFIERANSLGAHLVRAIVVPYAGCLVFLTLDAAITWAHSLAVGGLANLHDTLSLYMLGLTATTLSMLVVLPYGLLCQYIMARAGARVARS